MCELEPWKAKWAEKAFKPNFFFKDMRDLHRFRPCIVLTSPASFSTSSASPGFVLGLGLGWVLGWLRVGSRWVPNLLRANLGVAVLAADGLVLVYGGASWGWSRVGLGLVSGGFKIGCSHGCV